MTAAPDSRLMVITSCRKAAAKTERTAPMSKRVALGRAVVASRTELSRTELLSLRYHSGSPGPSPRTTPLNDAERSTCAPGGGQDRQRVRINTLSAFLCD